MPIQLICRITIFASRGTLQPPFLAHLSARPNYPDTISVVNPATTTDCRRLGPDHAAPASKAIKLNGGEFLR
jgi:hypothetical protein